MTSEFTLAVHALVFLWHKKVSQTSAELAVNICTNPARVRKVMALLKKKELVTTQEGLDGGYKTREDGGDTTLLEIADALDEHVIVTRWRSGSIDMDCEIASGMAGVMDTIMEEMEGDCRARLKSITVAQIEWELTHKGTRS